MNPVNIDPELCRHLTRLTEERGCIHAILFTSDGILKAKSDSITRDTADSAAAALSGSQSLSRAKAIAAFCDREPGHPDMQWEVTPFVFRGVTSILMSAGDNTYIAASSRFHFSTSEVTLLTRETVKLVKTLQAHLGSAERSTA